jgi:hypothetical protein
MIDWLFYLFGGMVFFVFSAVAITHFIGAPSKKVLEQVLYLVVVFSPIPLWIWACVRIFAPWLSGL